ncbi:hypothetical protein JM946_01795 [Steroidobacter sp. S1-65]|uniref:Glycosyltransferase RgtA/B/C/D-like domain-containing protein n=1 Tax=Steroidobacter gossypii TaxID=2805490 RepID=A0ABS1WR47_9GAMM|nr:hypothetical protein [Steroidobacter gossypii]MBM0103451.1 hypothetical protein [Steroidobacter gossypii]
MRLQIRPTPLLLWLAVSCIAVVSCSLGMSAARIGDVYFPFGVDGFYHAVRILDTVEDPGAFYEFDPKIHAPEGSQLVWPWGYDYFMAKLVSAALALGLGADPLMILLWIPVAAVLVGTGLLMLVARRIGLGDWAMALAGLCMALSSSTQLLYMFGQIDHHFAEHICILAALAAGLSWFKSPSTASGVALGVTFGVAMAVHNALFILQAPFLATALVHWLHSQRAPLRPTLAFVAALLISALAVLLPSEPFRNFSFEFYLLSWFHLYVVCGTATVMVLLSLLQPTRRNFGVLVAVAAVLLAPLLNQISYARSFVDGSLGMLDQILEMRSPLQMFSDGQFARLTAFYSALFFLAPITFVFCAVRLWRERTGPRLLFWVWCVFGLALMMTQIRMHYFGTFALYLPWLLVAQEIGSQHPERHKQGLLAASLLLVLAYAPALRYELIAPAPKAGERRFLPLYPMFEPLRKACAEDPGVVLADTNAGHYIRYFTDCSVIANNFLLTEQHFRKADQVNRLFSVPQEHFTERAPFVKYILVRAGDIKPKGNGGFDYSFYGPLEPTLSNPLLLAPAASISPDFELLYEVSVKIPTPDGEPQEVPYAKLYKVVAAPASPQTTSVYDVSQ